MIPLTAPNVENTTNPAISDPPPAPTSASAASAAIRVEEATWSSGKT